MSPRLPTPLKSISNALLGRVPLLILSGLNRGRRWSLAGAGSGYGSGRRESAQLRVLWELMRPGDVVWDVGAHYGFVTLCASARVGPAGRVEAFEPSAANRAFLERHVRWNRLGNVGVHPYAVGSFDGEARFGGGGTSKQHRLDGGAEVVQVRTVESLLASGACARPTFMKIDVEGAEDQILATALPLLPPATRLLVAVHSADVHARCRAALEAVGYRVVESARMRRYLRGRWRGDADLVALGPGWAGAERDLALLERVGF